MEEQLISLETGILAKAKGFYFTNVITSQGAFEENIVQFYNQDGYLCTEMDYSDKCCVLDADEDYIGEIPCAPQSLLQRWLREKHNIVVLITYKNSETSVVKGINSVAFNVEIYKLRSGDAFKQLKVIEYSDDYEATLEFALQEALKLIKNK